MNYQILACKWRPQFFSEVVGQEHVLTALKNSLLLGRIHHAWLFSGTRGIGKTSIARLLAKSLNCEAGITINPCNLCNNCNEIRRGCFVDLIEIDAASRTKVEDIRDLLDNVQYSPSRGRYKIYLIDEVHMLSRHSFNALLKTLEEPPSHVKFLLATTDPQKLPITVLSRCLQFHLTLLSIEKIYTQLEFILNKEHINYDVQALHLLARSAEGSLRDALNLTEQAIAYGNGKLTTKVVNKMLGTLDNDQALFIIEAIVRADGECILRLINNAASCGVEWESILVEMQILLQRIAMIQLSNNDELILENITNITSVKRRMLNLAKIMLPNDIQFYYQTLLIGRKELPFAPSPRIGVEMTLLRIITFHPKKSTSNTKTTKNLWLTIPKTDLELEMLSMF